MVNLDEEELASAIERSHHAQMQDKQKLIDFLTFLILKSKIQNEDALYETQSLELLEFHLIIREQLNFSR